MTKGNKPININFKIEPDEELYHMFGELQKRQYPHVTSNVGIVRELIKDKFSSNLDPQVYQIPDKIYDTLKHLPTTPIGKQKGWDSPTGIIDNIIRETISAINSMSIIQEQVIIHLNEDEKYIARKIKEDVIRNYPKRQLQNGEMDYTIEDLLNLLNWDIGQKRKLEMILKEWINARYIFSSDYNDNIHYIVKVNIR